jgi:hypothetical protein
MQFLSGDPQAGIKQRFGVATDPAERGVDPGPCQAITKRSHGKNCPTNDRLKIA